MLADLLEKLGPNPAGEKPLVGVSACLLGRAVRYNGETKYHAPTAENLEERVTLREYCPEVGIGLPVPRPPIQVVWRDGERRVRGVSEPERDFTDALRSYAEGLETELDGFILKARSPSCGLDSAPLMDAAGREIGLTSGAFADALRARFPALPLCDEAELESDPGRAGFLLRVYCHFRLRREPDAGPRLLRQARQLDGRFRRMMEEQVRLFPV